MKPRFINQPDLAPDRLLSAYAVGVFPMADERGRLQWLSPDPRAIIELEFFTPSRSLRALIRRNVFRVTVNESFREVMEACAEREEGTWISGEIRAAYQHLHEMGVAHSVEAWLGNRLVGGLYGVALGAAFFGESMFHRESNASKIALAELVERLRRHDFGLLDCQFQTDHLRSLGAIEIPRREYLRRLHVAVRRPRTFDEGSHAAYIAEPPRSRDPGEPLP